MKWYPLTAVQFIILLFLVAVAYVFTVIQKYFLPDIVRPFSYLVFVVLVLLIFFFIVKPDEPMVLAQTLTVFLGVIAVILILIQDGIIAHTLSWRTGVVLFGAVARPRGSRVLLQEDPRPHPGEMKIRSPVPWRIGTREIPSPFMRDLQREGG